MGIALVTGGSGYVAGHLVALLLREGHVVHTTVRSLANLKKLAGLSALQHRYPVHLKIFEADLLREGSFDEAMRGCEVVYHVASPFFLPEQIKDPYRDLLAPALAGTRNVLQSVNKMDTVGRVVLTSTVGAIFGDYTDVRQMDNGVLSEKYFNTSSSLERNPYHYSKVVAEREAWSICQKQSRWTMVAINPGLILGPAFTSSSDSGSLYLLDELFRGLFFYGAPNFSFSYADVRDVALAHLRAATEPRANGRYIVAERTMISFLEIAKIVRRFHRRPALIPQHATPDWLVRILGPLFGLTQEYIRSHLGIRFPIDNQRSIVDLTMRYRPIEETLRDHYQSWVDWRNKARG